MSNDQQVSKEDFRDYKEHVKEQDTYLNERIDKADEQRADIQNRLIGLEKDVTNLQDKIKSLIDIRAWLIAAGVIGTLVFGIINTFRGCS